MGWVAHVGRGCSASSVSTHSSKLTWGEKTIEQSLLAGGGRGGGGPHRGGWGKQLLQPLPGQKLEQLIVQLGHVHVNI